MKRISIGLLIGIAAGIIDVIPMFAMKLPWISNLSAFTMWVVIGFFISIIDLKINPIIKGILIAFLSVLPTAFLIGKDDPKSLIPVAVMTVVLGSLVGFTFDKIATKK